MAGSQSQHSLPHCSDLTNAGAADRLQEEIESNMRVGLSTNARRAGRAADHICWQRRMKWSTDPKALRTMKKLRKKLREKLEDAEEAPKQTSPLPGTPRA